MALLPKCPACAAAYLGFFSAFGIDQWAPGYLWPLTYVLFAASIALLGFRAWRSSFYLPLVLSLTGAALLVIARICDWTPMILWAGSALFVLGALWTFRRGHKADSAPCHPGELSEAVLP